jgi:serine/threonine-protein kinase
MKRASENLVRCSTCDKLWPEKHRVCPDDGSPLDEGTVLAQTPIPERMFGRPRTPLPAPAEIVASLTKVVKSPARQIHQDLVPGSIVGEYAIEARLGAGSMGEVFAAVHVLIGKRVAIKVISPLLSANETAVARFLDEARAACAIGHPGIVDIHAAGQLEDGRCYLVMEHLNGETLGAHMARQRLSFDEAVEIIDQMCRALAVAHECGIVHRDLKPENVFLVNVPGQKEEIVKLLDFGLAKLTNHAASLRRTETGQMMGTPLYVSPEQAKGLADVDHRTDIYALGCMAYEMFLDQPPFVAKSAAEIIAMHLNTPVPVPKVHVQLDPLLQGMLAKQATSRPSLLEIRTVLASVRVSKLPDTMPVRPIPSLISIVVLAMVLIAGVLAVLLASRSARTVNPPILQPLFSIDAPSSTPVVTAIPDAAVPAVSVDAAVPAPVRPKRKTIPKEPPALAPDSNRSTINPFDRKNKP